MAIVGKYGTPGLDKVYTLPEVLKQKAPDGSYMPAIDVLSGRFPMLEEGQWAQANDDTSHEFSRNATEPVGTLVRYNEGTDTEAAVTIPVKEQLCRLESVLKIDTRVLEKSPDAVRYIKDQEATFMRGLIKTWHKIIFSQRVGAIGSTTTVFNGDMASDPKTINGLQKRYNALTTVSSPVDNVRSFAGAASGSMSSIWLIKHGEDGLQFLYPRTASRTLRIKNLKEQLVRDVNGKEYTALWERFEWEFGLMVGDERNVQRLCNIVPATFAANAAAVAENALIDMCERLAGGETDGCVFYANADLMAGFRKFLNTKGNVWFSEQTVWGRKMLTFQDVPIVRIDTLSGNELTIV